MKPRDAMQTMDWRPEDLPRHALALRRLAAELVRGAEQRDDLAALDDEGAVWMATYGDGVWRHDGEKLEHSPVQQPP